MTDGGNGDDFLVEKAQEGDLEAFTELVSRYENQIYTLILRMVGNESDARDLVQDTFIKVIDHLENFRGDSSFRTWLVKIATNLTLNHIRKGQSHKTQTLDDSLPPESFQSVPHPQNISPWKESPEEILDNRETRVLLEEALEELDEKYRTVFLLRDGEGLSTRETAEILGLSTSNVKVRLMRARMYLREKLTEKFGDSSRRLKHEH